MAPAPGWYRDPADASVQRWWDGRGWTDRVRRPAPAPPPDPPADAAPDPWPVLEITTRPVRRARRRPRTLGRAAAAVVGVVVLAIGVSTVLGGDDPAPTWRGEEIGDPEAVLVRAEERLAEVVEERGGATARSSRCYFSRTDQDDSDVGDVVRCGPVLFVDGDPDETWLTWALTEEGRGDGAPVALAVAEEPDPTDPVALDRGEELVRPDGETAPDGSGGLEVPAPRRAEPGLLRTDALDGVDLAAPEGAAAVVVTHGARYAVTGLAHPERIGRGDDARRPAEGERFLAVELAQGLGEVADAPPRDVVRVEVEGEERVPLPDVDEDAADVTGTYLLSAPEAAAVHLVVTTGEVVQRLSLVDGTRADDTASVLLREGRRAEVGGSGPLGFSLAQGGQVSPVINVTVGARVVRLAYFYGADGTVVPPDPAGAWIVVAADYGWPPEAFAAGALVVTGLGPEVWRLRLGDETIAAVDLAPEPDRVVIGFAVPADITEGTLVVGGTQPGPVVFDTGSNRVEIPFSLPG